MILFYFLFMLFLKLRGGEGEIINEVERNLGCKIWGFLSDSNFVVKCF